jgi:hypothetical protein
VSITEGGAKALIQAVPRPDYTVKSKGIALHLLCVMLLWSMSFYESHGDDSIKYPNENTKNSILITLIMMTDDMGARVTGKARPSQRMLSLDDVRTHPTVQCSTVQHRISI